MLSPREPRLTDPSSHDQHHAMPAAAAPILKVKNLFLRRDQTVILDHVNWTVQPRENWVILGANGSGKTSLLRAITGYLAPTDGGIELLGEEFGESDWRELRLRIGVVTNSFGSLVPVCENAVDTVVSGKFAQLDLWQRGDEKDQRTAQRLLKQVDATYLANRQWQHLSQGERQRVLIARALMARPKLLILDEPCAGLDPVARRDFLALVDRLAVSRSAPALVLVTHHVEEITPAFTHTLLLREGRVLVSGPRKTTLNAKNLSAVFGTSMKLTKSAQGLRLGFTDGNPSR